MALSIWNEIDEQKVADGICIGDLNFYLILEMMLEDPAGFDRAKRNADEWVGELRHEGEFEEKTKELVDAYADQLAKLDPV